MAWIEFHTELRDHWKIHRLKDSLEIKYTEALGIMGCLWTWAALQSPKGDISIFTDAEISAAARYDGDQKAFRRALKSAKLLDASGKLHDWHKHGITMLLSSRKRQKQYRNKLRNGDITQTQLLRPSYRTVPFLPDLTKPLTLAPNDASRLPKKQNSYDKDLVDEVCRSFNDEKSRGFYIQQARRLGDGLLRELYRDVRSRIDTGEDIANPGAYLGEMLKNEKS